MLMSGLSNVRDLHLTHEALHSLDTAPDSATRLRALLALQQPSISTRIARSTIRRC